MKKDEWFCSQCGTSGKEHFDLWTLEDGGVLVVCSVCRMGFKNHRQRSERGSRTTDDEIKVAVGVKQP